MRTREHEIVYQETQSSDKTSKTWDLKYTDPITALYLEFEAVNGTTSNKGNFISDIITKVEIVEGSKPLYSLSQIELESLFFYKTKKAPVLFPSEHGSGIQRHGVYILFGRYLKDRQFAFNCAMYKNPQLKISWDLGAVQTVSATTAFATGTLKITAVAIVMEDTPVPTLFLSAREVDTFTMVTSGSKRVEMYTDYPWRLLMLKSYLQQKDIDECIERIKLDCDAGKFVPFDNRYVKQLDAEALAEFGLCVFKHDIFQKHQSAFREINNKENHGRWATFADANGYIVNVEYEWSSEGKLDILSNAGVALASDVKLTGMEAGHAPHATVPIPFGVMEDPETWFNATKYGKIDLYLYAPSSGAAGVSSVVLEQVRPNGQ